MVYGERVRLVDLWFHPFSIVLHGESYKCLAPLRNTKDRKHLQTTTDTSHRPSTWHYRKRNPGVKTHNTNQHSCRARLQHSHHPPLVPTRNWVIIISSQSMQPAAKHMRAEPHYTTDITRLSGDTQRPPPPAWGPSSGMADGQPKAHGLLLRRGVRG